MLVGFDPDARDVHFAGRTSRVPCERRCEHNRDAAQHQCARRLPVCDRCRAPRELERPGDVDASRVRGVQAWRENGSQGRLGSLLRHAERGRRGEWHRRRLPDRLRRDDGYRKQREILAARLCTTSTRARAIHSLCVRMAAASTHQSVRHLASTRSSAPTYTDQNLNREHARQQRWRLSVQRELASNLGLEVAYNGSYSDRIGRNIRADYLPEHTGMAATSGTRPQTRF